MLSFPPNPRPGDTYKQYVFDGTKWVCSGDDGGSSTVIVSPNPPADPEVGQLWWSTTNNRLYVFTPQGWVAASNVPLFTQTLDGIVPRTGPVPPNYVLQANAQWGPVPEPPIFSGMLDGIVPRTSGVPSSYVLYSNRQWAPISVGRFTVSADGVVPRTAGAPSNYMLSANGSWISPSTVSLDDGYF